MQVSRLISSFISNIQLDNSLLAGKALQIENFNFR